MDKDTKEPILDDVGNPITASGTFTPKLTSGKVELIFMLDTTNLGGKPSRKRVSCILPLEYEQKEA